ncbi:MAG: tRNA-(ms[2]io[6]A)-hydroxylase [Gammaproteobacteria bacterium]|nr:tRNA-(ms[2]io[6]A)-hydroxylase [Gammaproteobacteria bacterium]NNC96960.1 tRNA-(ms[2]io[6]A)-hydroxylase [Gammaproteobacteria bacterium]NNM14570.1 tRNA-(ms[2]io[6]A)-hydroxylase [Gammaproteobacteria bacterium]
MKVTVIVQSQVNKLNPDQHSQVPVAISEFLHCLTPDAWLQTACTKLPELLIDHANCEKKAASTAISLMFRYSEKADICYRMSRLAREELRHYEQVLKIIQQRNIQLTILKPSRYAGSLMQHVAFEEPHRLPELLIVGGIIEARSCERFAALIPYLDQNDESELAKFYRGLLASEARHFEHYLELAKTYSADVFSSEEFDQKVQFLLDQEAQLIQAVDSEFHFHSGKPVIPD